MKTKPLHNLTEENIAEAIALFNSAKSEIEKALKDYLHDASYIEDDSVERPSSSRRWDVEQFLLKDILGVLFGTSAEELFYDEKNDAVDPAIFAWCEEAVSEIADLTEAWEGFSSGEAEREREERSSDYWFAVL